MFSFGCSRPDWAEDWALCEDYPEGVVDPDFPGCERCYWYTGNVLDRSGDDW